jgi:hypothetical protein
MLVISLSMLEVFNQKKKKKGLCHCDNGQAKQFG